MEVLYKSERLKNTVEIERKRNKEYGDLAENVKNRVNMLKTIENLRDVSHLPPIERHKLEGDFSSCFSINVKNKYNPNRIVFEPVGQYNAEDLSTVIVINIVYIGNYHKG